VRCTRLSLSSLVQIQTLVKNWRETARTLFSGTWKFGDDGVVKCRDDAGRLLRSEAMKPQDITQRVKQKHHWEGGVCLAFGDQVLCWLYGSVKEGEDYTLRFNRNANKLELVKANTCPDVITAHMDLLS
jgi:hypothetical protein